MTNYINEPMREKVEETLKIFIFFYPSITFFAIAVAH